MFQEANPQLMRLLVDERHAELRRSIGAGRLRREARRARPPRRRRHRAGPSR